MKGLILVVILALIHRSGSRNGENGMRNGKITGLDAVYVSVTTKSAFIGLTKEHLFIKSAQLGDSVWVQGDGIYRDSRQIKE